MTRKHRRMVLVGVCALGLGAATALVLTAFSDNMVFFLAPSDVASKAPPPGRSFRLGGLVKQGSVEKIRVEGKPAARFVITDGKATVEVQYVGLLPDLFREGQGVVALGTMAPGGQFAASEVLAKHDATYMPPEVEAALKKSGYWNPDSGKPPPPASTWNTLKPTASQGG
jgi:cytochrome c-type biogenesis protein CcmE